MAQLAIKGYKNRGKEVIEILKMLGGQNYSQNLLGGTEYNYYYIGDYSTISCIPKENIDSSFVKFTLEEFLNKYPYKVGDEVIAYVEGCLAQFTIQGIRWNHELNKVEYKICSSWCDVSLIQPYKEQETKKTSTEFFSTEFFDIYCKNCGSQRCTAEGEWLEECKHYKEETMEEKKINQMSLANCGLDEVEIVLGDKFELVNREGKYYAVRKKPEYPKTYEECCDVLKIPNDERYIDIDVPLDYNKLLYAFTELLICRDAYWKIAEDWKPNLDSKQHKFAISNVGNKISFEVYGEYNSILCFPTEEIRDAFYENFKDLINEVKELL